MVILLLATTICIASVCSEQQVCHNQPPTNCRKHRLYCGDGWCNTKELQGCVPTSRCVHNICRRVVCMAEFNRMFYMEFLPSQLDPELCTHIVYSGTKIITGKMILGNVQEDLLRQVVKFKLTHPYLKIMLSVRAWDKRNLAFRNMAKSKYYRRRFVDSVLQVLYKYGLHGLNLDWEYPSARDKLFFTYLCKDLISAFKRKEYLLSANVHYDPQVIANIYEVSEIIKYLDFLNINTQDSSGFWDFNISLKELDYGSEFSDLDYRSPSTAIYNVVNAWIDLGAPANKLVLSLPGYAKTYTLTNDFTTPDHRNWLGGRGHFGPYSNYYGKLFFYEVCDILKGRVDIKRDDPQIGPFIRIGTQWIRYDNQSSIKRKVQYILKNNLGGVMFDGLHGDDFKAHHCGDRKFPLLRAINQACGLTP